MSIISQKNKRYFVNIRQNRQQFNPADIADKCGNNTGKTVSIKVERELSWSRLRDNF